MVIVLNRVRGSLIDEMIPSMDGTSMVGMLIRLAIGANHAICYYDEGSTVTNAGLEKKIAPSLS